MLNVLDMITVVTEYVRDNNFKITKVSPKPPKMDFDKGVKQEIATFGGGCYWGLEKMFSQVEGVIATQVGFMSTEEPGNIDDEPSYEELKSGSLGHIEVVQVQFDANKIRYEELLKRFWTFHDPTTFCRQGSCEGQ